MSVDGVSSSSSPLLVVSELKLEMKVASVMKDVSDWPETNEPSSSPGAAQNRGPVFDTGAAFWGECTGDTRRMGKR
jgi:hypothetical protein